jgi:flavin-dependent dehydrogenase
MAALKPIAVVGGGLAGLTLGIGLRRRGIPVAVWEAGAYPRHRVCGEFISGNGPAVLRRLGLRELFENAGAIHAESATFISGHHCSPVRKLPEPALCLSRYSMDALLAQEFEARGGELHSRTRRPEAGADEGVVVASGRQAQPTENGWRWFGLKIHARNVNPTADLEMHVSKDNYVGVNRISGGEINVCGLFRARSGRTHESGLEMLRGEPGSPLRERLASAQFDQDSFCSVAGLSLIPQRASAKTECRIGDAITMIPPVTGNGMSMAFESAEIAIEPLSRYSRGEMNWAEARHAIADGCDAAFTERLKWARRLQWLMFSPLLRTTLGKVLLRSDRLWDLMFAKTR